MSKTIMRDASLALTGAEYVREKLTALAGLGPNSLYDQVYAIKFRVKSLDSLVNKVIEKKKTKAYSAFDATDIVGMRLLCLYAEDLPTATKAFIGFLRFCQSPEVRLMDGFEIDDCIKEVVVYKSDRNARVYDAVYHYCKQIGLSLQTHDGESKVRIIEHGEAAAKTYSSIHFVCNAISHASGAGKSIPVEVQIRTLFEDAWSEIDHSLEYKLGQGKNRRLPAKLKPVHKAYRSQPNRLKGILEDAGTSAQDVRSGYSFITEAWKSSSEKVNIYNLKRIFWGYDYEENFNLSEANESFELDLLSNVIKSAKKIRISVRNPIENQKESESLISDIDTQIAQIDALREAIHDQNSNISQSVDLRNLKYFVSMEKAISLTWKNQIAKAYSPLLVDENANLLYEARKLYFELEAEESFQEDSILNFRIGCVMEELGEEEYGKFFLDRAFIHLSDDERLNASEFSWIIPHYIGYVSWKKRANLLNIGIKNGNSRINAEEQKSIVVEALFFARCAHFRFERIKSKNEFYEASAEKAVINNLVSYVWEIADLCGSAGDFESDIEELQEEILVEYPDHEPVPFRDLLDSLIHDAANATLAHQHDTLMKCYHMLGDEEKTTQHRGLCYAMMEKEGWKRKEGLNELYWYAQDQTSQKSVVRKVANHLKI